MQPPAKKHTYEVCPRKDHRSVDLISNALPFGRLWQRARIVFDCRMANDPATINKQSTNENNTDVDRWLMLAGCGSMENHVRNRDAVDRNRYLVEHNAVDTICACP
jgi:hypothetical protein